MAARIVSRCVAVLAASAALTAAAVQPGHTNPYHGFRCSGDAVWRCAWIGHGDSVVRGYARVTDNGGHHDVAVSNVRLERYVSGQWEQVTEDPDYDGWWDYREIGGANRGLACRPGTSARYRSVALFSWRRDGTSTISRDWYSSDPATIIC